MDFLTRTGLRLIVALCTFSCAQVLFAQSFRRVTGADDVEVGARYVLAASVYNDPCSVYAVVRQEATGTGKKNRVARLFGTDENGRIQIESADIAVFELAQSGTSYTLRDVHSGGFLAYSNKKTTENKTGLYTMTDEDMAGAPSSSGTFYKTFKFDFSLTKTCLVTAQKITTATTSRCFYLLPAYPIADSFSLYAKEDMAGTLCLYKEVVAPTLENEASGDWAFRGDWLAEDLSQIDFSKALRIDFTGIEVPEDWSGVAMAAATLPGEYVWTYVRQGEGARLPGGWPNVIEVYPSGASVPGRAVTAIKGGDACAWPPKYPFHTAPGRGISWFRTIPGDGGWLTAGLPFAVQTLTRETPEGEPLEVERRMYEKQAAEGAVFRKARDAEEWVAGEACLWRPVSPWAGTVCFHADEVPVQAGDGVLPEQAGFHAAFMPYEVTDGDARIYMLDETGEKFVRAAAGSRIHTGRGFLVWPEGAEKTVRMIVRDGTTDCMTVRKAADGSVPLYTPAGVKAGVWQPSAPLPVSLPKGIYLTPHGKVVKP